MYISLTSIFKNQHILLTTLQSIVNQSKLPDKIFLYLSEEPYMLDVGFQKKEITCQELLVFLQEHENVIQVCWVDNQGSFRKLLPLLREKWDEDCIIITIDDDTVYDKDLIKNMVCDYRIHECVISYRGFTPKMKTLSQFNYIQRGSLIAKHLYNFPTGKGGILYKPQFFHETGQLIFNRNLYMNLCAAQDDVWFYLLRIKNQVDCFVDNCKKYMTKDLSNHGLYATFNKKNNNNTLVLRNTLQQINMHP